MKLNDLVLETYVNMDNYISFREDVKKYMKDISWLRSFSKNELKELIKNGSMLWVYTLNDEIVCSMMFIKLNKDEINELGFDIDPNYCGEIGSMMVNYKYIGNGLQYQMLEVLDNYFTDNNLKYALGTIHPENSYSINNALKSGYEFSSCKVFPRGIRNVYIKKY